MTSRHIAPSLLMASLIAFAAPAAMASDELAGALFGAGAGAVIGHMVGGNDAAVVGGVFGAILGAAIADDDHRHVAPRPRPYGAYGPTVVRYTQPPRPVPYYARQEWRHERDGYRDGHRDRNEYRWREERWERNRHDWYDGRGYRDEAPRDYRNWR